MVWRLGWFPLSPPQEPGCSNPQATRETLLERWFEWFAGFLQKVFLAAVFAWVLSARLVVGFDPVHLCKNNTLIRQTLFFVGFDIYLFLRGWAPRSCGGACRSGGCCAANGSRTRCSGTNTPPRGPSAAAKPHTHTHVWVCLKGCAQSWVHFGVP